MGSAVLDLQKAISARNQSPTQLLRQARVIAGKLNLADLEKWVALELGGYPADTEPPDYRKIETDGVEVHNPIIGWRCAGNFDLKLRARQPIAEIEYLSQGKGLDTALTVRESARAASGTAVGTEVLLRVRVKRTQLKTILALVTDELLKWTIELQKRGIKGADMDSAEQEKQTITYQTVNIRKMIGVAGSVHGSQVTVHDASSVAQAMPGQKIAAKGQDAGPNKDSAARKKERRRSIPKAVETEVLTKSRRRCCLCFGLNGDLAEKLGHIAHLDQDRTNNKPDNLAWLCFNHHDSYDSQRSQGKGFTQDEVKAYRKQLWLAIAQAPPPDPQ